MRLPFMLLVLVLLTSFSERKCNAVIVAEATKRSWVSGAPGGKSGVTYTVKLVIKSNEKIVVNSLWLRKENVPFDLEFFADSGNKSFAKGDSVFLVYNQINNGSVTDFTPKKLPFEYKGEALIEYVVKHRTRYCVVKQFQELKSLKGE